MTTEPHGSTRTCTWDRGGVVVVIMTIVFKLAQKKKNGGKLIECDTLLVWITWSRRRRLASRERMAPIFQ